MPRRLPAPCSTPGCPTLTTERTCPAHGRSTQRQYDQARGSAASRGYDARWRRLRLLVLRAEPLCRECGTEGRVTPAADVDHITPLRRGGTNDRRNLQPLCHSCHSRKTQAETTSGATG